MINPNDVLTYEQLKALVIELESKLLANREAQPVAVTDEMALAFHRALNDGGIGESDLEEIKVGLRGALCNITAPPAPAVPQDYFGALVEKARLSADKAMQKYPQPNYVLNKVAEESGEVIKAVIHYTEGREEWANVEGEIIDNLAMLIRLVIEGDQVIGFTPPDACRAAMLAQDTQPPTDNTPAQFEALAPKQPFKIGDIVRQHIIGNRYDYAKVIYADPCGALDVKEIGTGLCFGWSASMCELAPCKDA